nr:hypothetical protein [Micromonospora sp. DSM 115978]
MAAAVATLQDAERAYEQLQGSGGKVRGGDVRQLLADVMIRRARIQAVAGRRLSAVADAQGAALAVLDRIDDDASEAARLDAARVIGLAGFVQLVVGGDPDLAVGAADWAI